MAGQEENEAEWQGVQNDGHMSRDEESDGVGSGLEPLNEKRVEESPDKADLTASRPDGRQELRTGATGEGLSPTRSGPGAGASAASIFSQTQQPIPRSQRRGLLGRFTIIPEVADPRDYNDSTKWVMTSVVALAAATSSTGSSISYPALAQMARGLHTTTTVANLSLAFYMLAMAIAPLWWSAFSEKLGRRTIYILSFALFAVFSVLSAVSVDIGMLIAMRILSGGAAASVQAVGAGTVADLWEPRVRGRAMGVFYLGPLAGPGFAPVVGGALAQGFGWRAALWFLVGFGGMLLLLILFCLPETLARRGDVDGEGEGEVQGEEKVGYAKRTARMFKGVCWGIFEPFTVLELLRYPPIAVAVFSAAIAFGSLFVMNVSIQSDFGNPPYNFDTISVGLLYLSPTLGYAVSSLLGGRWIDIIMAREARRAGRHDAAGEPIYLPEDRMKENMWLAASLYPAGMLWYGWTADRGLIWIVPCVAGFFFGAGTMLVFGCVTTVLTEFTPKRSSSGVAINNFARNILSATGAVVTQPLINAVGTGWTCTMVALFAWVTGNAAIWAMRTWGPKWREGMDRTLNQGA